MHGQYEMLNTPVGDASQALKTAGRLGGDAASAGGRRTFAFCTLGRACAPGGGETASDSASYSGALLVSDCEGLCPKTTWVDANARSTPNRSKKTASRCRGSWTTPLAVRQVQRLRRSVPSRRVLARSSVSFWFLFCLRLLLLVFFSPFFEHLSVIFLFF